MKRVILLLGQSILCLFAFSQHAAQLSPGNWRAELVRPDGNNIVFNFEVTNDAGKPMMYIRNAAERLAVDDITLAGDSVFIRLPFFDSQFRAAFAGDKLLKGVWIKRLADRNVVMPFVAENLGEKNFRFKTAFSKPMVNIRGRWAVTFTNPDSKKTSKAVGVFNQDGTKLTGSFITRAGDYRYLEGVVDGDSLKLSGFDGGYAISFTARAVNDSTITGGKFFSGTGPVPRKWKAVKDPSASLDVDSSLINLKPGVSSKLSFTFKDTSGNFVSFSDEKFKNKVIILQLLGSWCPNCMDETVFLNEIYSKYRTRGLEIIGLAYERSGDFTRSRQSVKNFMRRLKVEYPVLITPVAASDPENAAKTLPQLEKISIFPTTIFSDKHGNIYKIHTGFNGPGTAGDYEQQKNEYIDIVETLLEMK